MKNLHLIAATLALATLAACGDNPAEVASPPPPAPPPVVSSEVPTSAYASVVAFVEYLGAMLSSETSEPLALGSTTPPTSETSEPLAVK